MDKVRYEGILGLPAIPRFVPAEHYKVQFEPVSIVHVTKGFLDSIEGIVELDLNATEICLQTLRRKFHGDDLWAGLRLGSSPTHLAHIYEALKGQPNGRPEWEYAGRWMKVREAGTAPLLIDRRANSFIYFDAEQLPHVVRLFYYDHELAKNSAEFVSMSYPRSGWVIAERQPGSADWAYPGERIGHYNI